MILLSSGALHTADGIWLWAGAPTKSPKEFRSAVWLRCEWETQAGEVAGGGRGRDQGAGAHQGDHGRSRCLGTRVDGTRVDGTRVDGTRVTETRADARGVRAVLLCRTLVQSCCAALLCCAVRALCERCG